MNKEKLDNILQGLPFTLNKGQLTFITKFIESKGNWCLAGLAGSGKSTIMYILKLYYGDEIVFFASTGVASLNMPNGIGCGTAHGGLSLPLELSTEYDYRKVGSKCSVMFASSDLVKIIVIDEVFGLNSDNLDMIHRRITRYNKRTAKRKARDIRLLVVGDSAQQVTITDKPLKRELRKRWGSHFMFSSEVWDRFDFEYAVLHQGERQKNKTDLSCLNVIRYHEKKRFPRCLAWLNKKYKGNIPKDQLVLAATNKTVDRINEEFLTRNVNPKITFTGRLAGTFPLGDLHVKMEFIACVGRKVMTINNDSPMNGERWVNGSTGVIIDVYAGQGVTVLFDTGVEEFVEYNLWEEKKRYVKKDVKQEDGTLKDEMVEELLGSFSQLPLVPSNAMSISKSQGVTLSSPFVIDLEDSGLYTSSYLEDFGTNFAYVGISRATSLDLITFATRVTPQHIKHCSESLDFWYYMCEHSVI